MGLCKKDPEKEEKKKAEKEEKKKLKEEKKRLKKEAKEAKKNGNQPKPENPPGGAGTSTTGSAAGAKVVSPPPSDHHIRYQTPVPEPVYTSTDKGMKKCCRPLCLASRKPEPVHPYDTASQPYIRDCMNTPILFIRCCLIIGFVMDALLAVKYDEWSDKYRTPQASTDADPVYDSHYTYFWASFGTAILSALIKLFLYIKTFKGLYLHKSETYLKLIRQMFICLALVSVSFVYPTTWRTIFCFASEFFVVITVAACGYVVWHWSFYDITGNELRYTEFMRPKVDRDWEKHLGWRTPTEQVEKMSVRRKMSDMHKKGIRSFTCCTFLVFVAVVANFAFEFWKITNSQARTYPLWAIENAAVDQGSKSNSNRVLLVVVEGLEYAQLTGNAGLRAFMESSSMSADSYTFRMTSSLPTQSAPDWATIVSGVSPENTGFLGSYLTAETLSGMPFDTIYARANTLSTGNGFAGNPDWRDIIGDGANRLYADGTVEDWVNTDNYNNKSSYPADVLRVNITTNAFTGSPQDYPLFITQLSNVGTQAMWYGTDSSQYDGAVTLAASQLSELKALVDARTDTIMIIMGDHGATRNRGWGGTGKAETDIPFIVYKNNSALGSNGIWAGAG